jgi:hypothetical protein
MSIVGFELRFDAAGFFEARVWVADFMVADRGCLFIVHILV